MHQYSTDSPYILGYHNRSENGYLPCFGLQLSHPDGKPALTRASLFKTLPFRIGINGRRFLFNVTSGRLFEAIVTGSAVVAVRMTTELRSV